MSKCRQVQVLRQSLKELESEALIEGWRIRYDYCKDKFIMNKEGHHKRSLVSFRVDKLLNSLTICDKYLYDPAEVNEATEIIEKWAVQ